MRKQELEVLILDIAESIDSGSLVEDQTIELKSVFPDNEKKAARQIAGLANAARSEGVTWIVGMDEVRGVIGVDKTEIADWWPAVKKHFSSACPSLETVAVKKLKGKTVLGLHFRTLEIPYLVNNPNGGQVISREIPWREGNSTRTAKRDDVLRMLVPRVKAPQLEVLSMTVTFTSNLSVREFAIHSEVYLYSSTETTVTIPYHRSRIFVKAETLDKFEIPMKYEIGSLGSIRMHAEFSMISQTKNEGIVAGPGLFVIMGKLENFRLSIDDMRAQPLEIELELYCHEANAYLHKKVHIEKPTTDSLHQLQWIRQM